MDMYAFLCNYIDTTVILVEVKKTECCLKSLIVKIALLSEKLANSFWIRFVKQIPTGIVFSLVLTAFNPPNSSD